MLATCPGCGHGAVKAARGFHLCHSFSCFSRNSGHPNSETVEAGEQCSRIKHRANSCHGPPEAQKLPTLYLLLHPPITKLCFLQALLFVRNNYSSFFPCHLMTQSVLGDLHVLFFISHHIHYLLSNKRGEYGPILQMKSGLTKLKRVTQSLRDNKWWH